MNAPLATGTQVVIVKGCKARDILKGTKVMVRSVTPMGADYSHMVKVLIEVPATRMGLPARVLAFYARSANRLVDATIGLNDGNPLHRIEVRRA